MFYAASVTQAKKPTKEEIMDAVRQAGGAASPADIQRHFGISRSLLHRRLTALTEEGGLEHVRRGLYRLPSLQPVLSKESQQIVEILDRAALDGHVTGLAVLLPYLHQFVRQFSQIVYCEPIAQRAIAGELTSAGFIVIRLGRKANPAQADVEDRSRLVLLRTQPNAEQYGVHDYVAPAEKAWVDLLREAHRRTMPMQFLELGRILHNMLESDGRVKRLKRYARKQGYIAWVERALGEVPPTSDKRMEAVRNGFLS